MTVRNKARCEMRGAQRAAAIIHRYLRFARQTGLWCNEAVCDRHRTLLAFARALPRSSVVQCKPFHLSEWIEGHAAWKSNSTRQTKANLVKACFNWATREERIPFNPFAALRYEEAQPREPMDDDSLYQLLAHGNRRFACALRFLRLTGCRVSELCRMQWANVDLDDGVVVVHRHKSSRKTRRPRTIVLVPEASELLRSLVDSRAEVNVGPVFRNNRGQPWTRHSLGQALRRLKARTGTSTPATLHGIRHQFGTVAVRQGAPIKLVSLQMGHSSVVVTEKYYLHLESDVEAIREATKAACSRTTKLC